MALHEMNNTIIDSIITITQQRDRSSLDHSLVVVLSEFVPAESITLYRLFNSIHDDEIEKTAQVITGKGDVQEGNQFSSKPDAVQMQPEFIECIKGKETIYKKTGNQHASLMLPIYREQHPEGLLRIESKDKLSYIREPLESIIQVYQNYASILHESEFDTLTGLRNRRTFDKKIDALLKHQKKRETDSEIVERRFHEQTDCPWLAVIDIDNFKNINDKFGHVYGDEVLLLLAQKMKDSFRRNDILFRFGGEEFVVILEPISKDMAATALERFRKSIENFEFPQVGKVTISTGYSMVGRNDYPVTVLDNADKALYHAKNSGRNKIFCYDDLVELGIFKTVEANDDVELF